MQQQQVASGSSVSLLLMSRNPLSSKWMDVLHQVGLLHHPGRFGRQVDLYEASAPRGPIRGPWTGTTRTPSPSRSRPVGYSSLLLTLGCPWEHSTILPDSRHTSIALPATRALRAPFVHWRLSLLPPANHPAAPLSSAISSSQQHHSDPSLRTLASDLPGSPDTQAVAAKSG